MLHFEVKFFKEKFNLESATSYYIFSAMVDEFLKKEAVENNNEIKNMLLDYKIQIKLCLALMTHIT